MKYTIKLRRKYLILHEFIGLKAKVLKSTSTYKGISGRVVWETRNTFYLESNGTIKIVPKAGNTFIFFIGNKSIIVKGLKIVKHPIKRTKKLGLRI